MIEMLQVVRKSQVGICRANHGVPNSLLGPATQARNPAEWHWLTRVPSGIHYRKAGARGPA